MSANKSKTPTLPSKPFVIAVTAACGGSGVTHLAVDLAVALGRRAPTLLADNYNPWGVEYALNQEPCDDCPLPLQWLARTEGGGHLHPLPFSEQGQVLYNGGRVEQMFKLEVADIDTGAARDGFTFVVVDSEQMSRFDTEIKAAHRVDLVLFPIGSMHHYACAMKVVRQLENSSIPYMFVLNNVNEVPGHLEERIDLMQVRASDPRRWYAGEISQNLKPRRALFNNGAPRTITAEASTRPTSAHRMQTNDLAKACIAMRDQRVTM